MSEHTGMTDRCICRDRTTYLPEGEHFYGCPFYVEQPSQGTETAREFFDFRPDYTESLDRIATALENIAETLLQVRVGKP